MSFDDKYLHDLAKEQKLNLRKVARCHHDWKFSRYVSYGGNAHTEHVVGCGYDLFSCHKCHFSRRVTENSWRVLPIYGLTEKNKWVDIKKLRE